jgi:P-type Ca2+ transporter type 2C
MYPDKKRSSYPSSNPVATSTTSSSVYSRQQPISRSYSPVRAAEQFRTDSPPASAYFSSFTNQGHGIHGQAIPSADADSHFAYSTTLRRHHTEGMGVFPPANSYGYNSGEMNLLSRALRAFGITTQGATTRNDRTTSQSTEPLEDTPASKFAGLSIEVRFLQPYAGES